MPSVITVLEYTSFYQPWFEKLNRHWIEQYFWMEPIDVAVLQDPDGHIINKGGAILMASVDEDGQWWRRIECNACGYVGTEDSLREITNEQF